MMNLPEPNPEKLKAETLKPEPISYSAPPPAFPPHPMVQPSCRVVTDTKIVERAGMLMEQGREAEARELVHAMARALAYPKQVLAADIKIIAVTASAKEAA